MPSWKTFALLASSIFAINTAKAEVPHSFTAGTKAKASEVNENFEALDTRITTLESSVSTLESQASGNSPESSSEGSTQVETDPHPLSQYTPKTAEIGDVIATIEGRVFVLGALPFREYETSLLYKVFLPLERHNCSEIDSEINQNNGYRYTDNYSCSNGSDYYYEGGFSLRHNITELPDELFLISNFPSYFSDRPGEYSDIKTTFAKARESGEVDNTVEPREYNTNVIVSPELEVRTWNSTPLLHIRIDETQLIFHYRPIVSNYYETYTESLPQNSGPDFTSNIASENLNNHLDQTVLNQYKDLYDYIRIEPLTP